MNYQVVIFDLDGTLLDTLEAYRYFVGEGATQLVTRALPEAHRSEAIIGRCLNDFRETYATHWNVHTHLYEGIEELLDVLQERGIRLAVLSNKPHEFTQRCVETYLEKWSFDPVLGQRERVGVSHLLHTLRLSHLRPFLYKICNVQGEVLNRLIDLNIVLPGFGRPDPVMTFLEPSKQPHPGL